MRERETCLFLAITVLWFALAASLYGANKLAVGLAACAAFLQLYRFTFKP